MLINNTFVIMMIEICHMSQLLLDREDSRFITYINYTWLSFLVFLDVCCICISFAFCDFKRMEPLNIGTQSIIYLMCCVSRWTYSILMIVQSSQKKGLVLKHGNICAYVT